MILQQFIETIVRQYNFNLLYARALTADVTERQMTCIPAQGLINHPAFTIGHLVTGSAMMVEDLGCEYALPEGWNSLFQRKGPNDQTKPDTDTTKYPSKNALISELEHQHTKVINALYKVDDVKLSEEIKWRFGVYMPTLRDLITFMCINHEAMHLGQLAAWRRAMGLPPALGTL